MNIYFYRRPRVYKEQLPFEPGEKLEDGKELLFLLQLLGFIFLLLQSALHYFLAHGAKKKSREFSI